MERLEDVVNRYDEVMRTYKRDQQRAIGRGGVFADWQPKAAEFEWMWLQG